MDGRHKGAVCGAEVAALSARSVGQGAPLSGSFLGRGYQRFTVLVLAELTSLLTSAWATSIALF
jgi:hypothetical protein